MSEKYCSSRLKALNLYFNENETIEKIAVEAGCGQIYIISWIHHYKLDEELKSEFCFHKRYMIV